MSEDTEKLFGDRLRDARTYAGMTQGDLAKAVYLSKASISNYEKNKKYPAFDTILKLCDALNVSADFLFGLNRDYNYHEYISLSVNERHLIRNFRRLPADCKSIVIGETFKLIRQFVE